MTITTDDLVRREVFYCVSSLIHTLAGGAIEGRAATMSADLASLWEQAFELSAPLLDYEEAAKDAGWIRGGVIGTARNKDGAAYASADETWNATWRNICEMDEIEPYEREVFEHWIVSDWLADKLEERGEKVDRDFAGMTIWARTTTGQAISMDYVIEQIAADLNKPVAA